MKIKQERDVKTYLELHVLLVPYDINRFTTYNDDA